MENQGRKSRILNIAVITGAAALILSSVPAQATTLSSSTVGDAYSVKLSAKGAWSALWVKSETVTSDPTNNYADHDYMTVRHFGSFIQIVSLDAEGTDAPALTARRVSATNRLTDSLGDAWQSKFM